MATRRSSQKTSTFGSESAARLRSWYRANRRPLPWRESRDAYRIWISETMLQQTTTTAVIPYFERFLKRFPTLEQLAAASEGDVLKMWAGLGYYSRARNLLRAAQMLHERGEFPRNHLRLLEYPGFGPYTARAVASLAFSDPVGVLDGNVIRVICRHDSWPAEWWRPAVRRELQQRVDQWVQGQPSDEMNQALMELGATVCTPQRPTCSLCPLATTCSALREKSQSALPLPKPRRAREIWLWRPVVLIRRGRIAVTDQHSLPFLKRQLALPGRARKADRPPAKYDLRHSITHHDIFIQVERRGWRPVDVKWVLLADLHRHVPFSIVHKVVENHGAL